MALEFLRLHFAFEVSGIVVNSNGGLEFSPGNYLWKPRCTLSFANALIRSCSYIFSSVLEMYRFCVFHSCFDRITCVLVVEQRFTKFSLKDCQQMQIAY